jgi:hypothetical protein
MPSSNAILEGYLEQVSWRIMEQYPDIIRAMIRRRSGVYALYRRDKLYYVGLATNLMGRINGHLRDRHKGLWDRFSVYLTSQSDQQHVRELEALLLRILLPKGNRVSGRLRHAVNVSRALHAAMSDRDAQRRANLLGAAVAKRLRRRKLSMAEKPVITLAGIVSRRTTLKATYKGIEYRASLRVDGQVRYAHKLYESPTAAARSIVGRNVNGWSFWRYRKNGEWLRLRELRG